MYAFLSDCLSTNSPKIQQGKGGNIIPPQQTQSWWQLYLEKFKDPIIIVLLVVFALSIGVSTYEAFFMNKPWSVYIEPLGVLLALILSSGIAFIFEHKANNEFSLLNQAKDNRIVKVMRRTSEKGRVSMQQVMRSDVVVGDIVKLESGDEIPADGILLHAQNLTIDESAFTGEPYVHKTVDIQPNAQTAYPSNLLLRGTIVVEGSAFYRVTAVGLDTEEGKGALLERSMPNVQTPLNKQLEQLSRYISIAAFVIAGLIIVGRLIYYFFLAENPEISALAIFSYVLDSLMIAVTLIVVAVPEGLPMSVTMSLALSMRKMLREKNLVRKLHACETMGAATVICTDKTGTLTQNSMRVVHTNIYDCELLPCIVDNMAINSTAELERKEDGTIRVVGNPTEGALLTWLNDNGFKYASIREKAIVVQQQPFSSVTKQMSTTVKKGEEEIVYIKGAPEHLLNLCTRIAGNTTRETVLQQLSEMEERAMRTLGFAVCQKDECIFLGTVGILDPVREDVPYAMIMCTQHAGVRVIIVTGDNGRTAKEIGRQAGLHISDDPNECLDGPTFASMSDEQILSQLASLKILSRAKPEDKVRLVTLLQETGEVVAVTGDGTNDALALSKAQVGLSMGDGTARAKEASDITILNNSFASIITAIMWGRSLYINIQRFIVFQMIINVCACFIVLIGAFLGMDSPLTVTQMLWVNLIMDTFAALGLSSLPADEHVLEAHPRNPKSRIIDRRMCYLIFGVGLAFFIYLFGLWQLLWHSNITQVQDFFSWETIQLFCTGFGHIQHTKLHLSLYETSVFFTTFVLLQFWNLFNIKYFRTNRSMLRDLIELTYRPQRVTQTYSRGFLLVVGIILFGQILIVNCAGQFFHVCPLPWSDWLTLLGYTSIIFILPDVIRTIPYFKYLYILIKKYLQITKK